MTGVLGLMVAGGPSLKVTAPDITASQPPGTPVSGSSIAIASGGSGSYSYAWTGAIAGVTLSGTTTNTLTAAKTTTTVGVRTGGASVTATDMVTGATAAYSITIYLENT